MEKAKQKTKKTQAAKTRSHKELSKAFFYSPSMGESHCTANRRLHCGFFSGFVVAASSSPSQISVEKRTASEIMPSCLGARVMHT